MTSSSRSAREALQRELAKDAVTRTLCARPPVDELHRRGLVRGLVKGRESACLAAATAMLQRGLAQRHLAQTLEKRPSHEELVSRGILPPRKASRDGATCSPAMSRRHSM